MYVVLYYTILYSTAVNEQDRKTEQTPYGTVQQMTATCSDTVISRVALTACAPNLTYVQYSTVHVQYSTVQYRTSPSTVRYCTVRRTYLLYSTYTVAS